MQEKLISHDGRTYKYIPKENKYYIRVVSKVYNNENTGWTWQPLSLERVPKEVKQSK